MAKTSAGILMFRFVNQQLQVLLVHPGGPFWRSKDLGAWSIPKGEYDEKEDPLAAALREFEEETGHVADGNFIPLTPAAQSSGKLVTAWAVEGDLDPAAIKSNNFTMEWPPRSGKMREFPEADRAQWFDINSAIEHVLQGQVPIICELAQLLEHR